MATNQQIGFNFEIVFEEEVADPPEEFASSPVLETPTEAFLIPEIEEEARGRASQLEEEIPWTQYIRQVQLFFDEQQNEEFRELVSKLAAVYGTKNMTDTVAEAMRNAMRTAKV